MSHGRFLSFNPMQFILLFAPLHRGRNWSLVGWVFNNLGRDIKLHDHRARIWSHIWLVLLSCHPMGSNINTGSKIFRWILEDGSPAERDSFTMFHWCLSFQDVGGGWPGMSVCWMVLNSRGDFAESSPISLPVEYPYDAAMLNLRLNDTEDRLWALLS